MGTPSPCPCFVGTFEFLGVMGDSNGMREHKSFFVKHFPQIESGKCPAARNKRLLPALKYNPNPIS